jgi:hypothetical protein
MHAELRNRCSNYLAIGMPAGIGIVAVPNPGRLYPGGYTSSRPVASHRTCKIMNNKARWNASVRHTFFFWLRQPSQARPDGTPGMAWGQGSA